MCVVGDSGSCLVEGEIPYPALPVVQQATNYREIPHLITSLPFLVQESPDNIEEELKKEVKEKIIFLKKGIYAAVAAYLVGLGKVMGLILTNKIASICCEVEGRSFFPFIIYLIAITSSK